MDDITLLQLLEADGEMILAALNRDRSPAAAQEALEKALDRVSLRFAEQCGDAAVRGVAQAQLRAIRSALPLIDSVGEVRRWQRSAEKPVTRRMKPVSMGLLAVGAVLELSVMLGLMITGGRLTGAVAFIEALVPALLGMAALFWAGVRCGRPEKAPAQAPEVREEFLVDPERVWHHLKGMLLLADSAVDSARGESAAQLNKRAAAGQDSLNAEQLELFAELLENGYAQDTPDGREMVENMRYYLHGEGIDVVDLTPGRESWFEFLPAQKPGTIRPALACGDKLLKKGLAAHSFI